MKKAAKKKSVKKAPSKRKTAEPKNPQIAAGAGQDIVGLLSVLVQKLTVFEAKIDKVLSCLVAQPAAVVNVSKQPAAVVPAPKANRENRHMFQAVCADCSKDCEVPFKPREGRQVYCKGCFLRRRQKNANKPLEAQRPKQEILVNVASAKKSKAVKPVKAPEKSSSKSLKKKKPVVKKKRKASR